MDESDAIMRQTVDDLRRLLHQRRLEPAVAVGALVAVLAEFMVGYRFKMVTVAELLFQCGADFHDEWSKAIDAMGPEELARLMPTWLMPARRP